MSNISEEDKLSWGDVDFIEESASFCNDPLEFKDVDEIELSEAELTPSKPKFKVIGVVKGCIAPIGELSRNGRLYESSHWGRVLSNPQLQERIAGRKFFGMISHENKRIDDTNFKAGEISHICSLLEVRNDANGKPFLYGELEILDTPAGRILKAMYEGGAGLYVSTRAAGKLLESRDGKPYKIVDSSSYYIDSIDFVLNPGFLKAKPVFEASPSESAQVSESQINELNDKTIESDLNKRQDQMYDAQANAKTNPKAAAEATKKYEHALDLAQKEAERHDEILDQDEKGNHNHYKNESAEIAELNNKINQLTKIIEKVVDDVYEADNEPTQSVEDQLGDLLFNPSITEEAFEDVIAILKESKPELVNTIMENSRKKFNDEHAEKSGYKIDYYRFGGNKPYKIVPKDSSYFEASWSSPRYRSLKQAQKHILDTYNKPKENPEVTEEVKYSLPKGQKEDLLTPVYGAMNSKRARKGKKMLPDEKIKEESASEALNNFVSLMADSNITEEAFEEILDMIKGDLK